MRDQIYICHIKIFRLDWKCGLYCVCVARAQERYVPNVSLHSLLAQAEFQCLFKSSFVVLTRNMESKQNCSFNCKLVKIAQSNILPIRFYGKVITMTKENRKLFINSSLFYNVFFNTLNCFRMCSHLDSSRTNKVPFHWLYLSPLVYTR